MPASSSLAPSSNDAPPWSIHGSVLFWVVQIVLMVLGMDENAWPLLVAFIAVIVVSVVRLYLQRATARGVLVAIAVILVLASVLQGQTISTAVLIPALAGGLLMTRAAVRWVLPDPVPDVDDAPEPTP